MSISLLLSKKKKKKNAKNIEKYRETLRRAKTNKKETPNSDETNSKQFFLKSQWYNARIIFYIIQPT